MKFLPSLALAAAALGLVPPPAIFAAAPAPPDAAGSALLLPPMLVREHNGGPSWRYASVGGLEILSRCDDDTTTSFINGYLSRKLELEQLLPPQLQVRQSVPLAVILITPAVEKTMNEELVKTMNSRAKEETSGYVTSAASSWQVYQLVRTLPQLTLSDAESTAMVCTLDPSQHGPVLMKGETSTLLAGLTDKTTYSDINFTTGRIGAILGGRVPPLPTWFKSGFLAFYQEVNWTTHSDTIVASPVFWISDALTRQVRRNPTQPNGMASLTLLPLRKFFAGPLGGAVPLTPDESRLWYSQCSLFFHWAYSDAKRREAFWRFVDLSSRQEVSDDLIQQCFGLNSSRFEEALIAYLPTAVKSALPLISTASIRIPPFSLEKAPYADAARIKGDMGRKEIDYVKDAAPLAVAQYVAQVGAVLAGPVEDGERDPAQLAVFGLYDCDIGNTELALPLLEEAAAAHVARPTLYIQLARIRLQHAQSQPTGAKGKLGPEQVAAIVGLVRESRQYAPSLAEGYLLAADVWSQAAAAPSHENLALLAEGVELFPKNFDLVANAAKLYVEGGFGPDAIKLVDRALACAEPGSMTQYQLTQFRAQLAAR